MSRKRALKMVDPLPTALQDPEAAAAPAEPYETRAAFRRLFVSTLNYRQPPAEPDAQDLELQESIAAKGLLQNLNARPGPDGSFEVFAGGRRVRAVSRLVEAGRWDAEVENLPLRVYPGLSDADLILLSLIENVHRKDAHFLEEAAAVANAVRLLAGEGGPQRGDGVTAAVAASMGVSQRWVQILHQLDEDLHPEIKAFFLARPDLGIDLAKACRAVAGDLQLRALAFFERCFENSWTPKPQPLREFLLRDLPKVETAIFDPALYTGHTSRPDAQEPPTPSPRPDPPAAAPALDPEAQDFADELIGAALWEEGEETGYDEHSAAPAEPARFLDAEQFARLQEDAIEKQRQDLLATYPFVEVARVQWPGEALKGFVRHDGPEGGAVIAVTPDLAVKVFAGYVREDPASRTASSKTPAEAVLKNHYRLAHHTKTKALQRAVATSSYQAMRVLLVSLLGYPELCKVRIDDIPADDAVIDPTLAPRLAPLREVLGKLLSKEGRPGVDTPYPAFSFFSHDGATKAAQALELLAATPDTVIEALFTSLVAARVGSFAGYNPGPGDEPPAIALARLLKVEVETPELSDDFLQGYRKPHLLKVAHACGVTEPLEGTTSKQIRAAILAAPGRKTFFPPELGFATAKEIAAALGKVGSAPRPPKKEAPKAKKGPRASTTRKAARGEAIPLDAAAR